MRAFTGDIEQVPVAVSAIKVDGRRAYERVRGRRAGQLAARPVTVAASTRSSSPGPSPTCSTSTSWSSARRAPTSVRWPAISGRLGVGGHLTALRRTRVGPVRPRRRPARSTSSAELDDPVHAAAGRGGARRVPGARDRCRGARDAVLRHARSPRAAVAGRVRRDRPRRAVVALLRRGRGPRRPVLVFAPARLRRASIGLARAALAWAGAVPADWGRCVVTIGVFDGVHRGHPTIIGEAVARRRARACPSCCHLRAASVRGGAAGLAPAGADQHRAPRRTGRANWASTSSARCRSPSSSPGWRPTSSCTTRWSTSCTPSAVVVGENFRFGHKAAGDVALLRRLGPDLRVHRHGVPLLRDGRHAVERDLRPLLRARRRHGRRRCRRSAARTASTAWSSAATSAAASSASRPRTCAPTSGPRSRPTASTPGGSSAWTSGAAPSSPPVGVAAISVGTNPTFEVRQRRVEAYVLDFDGDLYGDTLGVEFVAPAARHGEVRRVEALVAQMHDDVAQTRTLMRVADADERSPTCSSS